MLRVKKWILWYKTQAQKKYWTAKAMILLAYSTLRKPAGTEFTVKGKKCGRFEYLRHILPLMANWK